MNPVNGISIQLTLDIHAAFDVILFGPKTSPYEGGQFKCKMMLPDNYPMDAPKLYFETKIYHPNIDINGQIKHDILIDSRWSPANSIRNVFEKI